MKRILITGGSSYLGTALREYLARRPGEYTVDSISVRGEDWKGMSFRGYDAVYHTAAIVHSEQSKNDSAQAELYDRVNGVLPVEIAEKARAEGVGQFIFLSSASVYGLTAPMGKTVWIDENTPLNPTDNYGRSKAKAEEDLKKLENGDFRVAILRPPMIYGKGCKGNYNVLAKFAGKLPMFPYVKNQRSMLYVENLCELVRLLIDSGEGGVFCPQNREYVNTCDMVKMIAAARNKKIVMVPGFGWALKLMGTVTDKVDKAFGSLCYTQSLSSYRQDYCLKDLETSVRETEA